jgi:hypothetical protein
LHHLVLGALKAAVDEKANQNKDADNSKKNPKSTTHTVLSPLPSAEGSS